MPMVDGAANCGIATEVADGVHPVRLVVTGCNFHHYAEQILTAESWVERDLHAAIASVTEVKFKTTRGGRFGMDTDDFNKRLRQEILDRGSWRSEVGWSLTLPNPVWLYPHGDLDLPGFRDAEERFDFAHIDEHRNARVLWNLLANRHRLTPDEQQTLDIYASRLLRAHWDGPGSGKAICDCVRAAVSELVDWRLPSKLTEGPYRSLAERSTRLPELDPAPPGQEGPKPVILGEVQLGNWALAYRDVGRVLAVRGQFRATPVTLFVIIALDGCLPGMISEGTVNRHQVDRVYGRLGPDVPVPTWVVGVDFDHAGEGAWHPRPEQASGAP